MAKTTCTQRALWTIALLAALAAPAAAAAEAASRQESAAIADAVLRRIEIGRPRTEIGVLVRDIEQAEEAAEGAVVTSVRAGSPAEAAGLAPGDLIVEFDRERVRSARQLARLVEETPAGRTAPVRLLRDGSPLTLNVTPAERRGRAGRGPQAFADRVRVEVDESGDQVRVEVDESGDQVRVEVDEAHRDDVEAFVEELAEAERSTGLGRLPRIVRGFADRRSGRIRLGIRAESVGGQLAEYFGADAGVLVEHVDAGATGAAAGLRAGDVITAIDGNAVDDIGALRRRLARLEPGAAFEVTVVRDRAEATLTVEPPDENENEERTRRRRGSAI